MTYLEGQIESRKAWIAYWQTVILSGAYKSKKIYHGFGTPEEAEFTDEEKLQDALDTLKRHTELLAELIENLAKDEEPK